MSEILSYILNQQDRPKTSVIAPILITSDIGDVYMGYLYITTGGHFAVSVVGEYSGREIQITAENTRGYTNMYAVNCTWFV